MTKCECCGRGPISPEEQESVDGEIVCLDCFYAYYDKCNLCGEDTDGLDDLCASCREEEDAT